MSGAAGSGFDPTQQHLRPAAGSAERTVVPDRERRALDELPWQQRRELGFVEAFAASVWRLASKPVGAFAALPSGGGLGSPWLFAAACWVSLGTLSELVDGLTSTLLPLKQPAGSLGELFQLTVGGYSLEWLPLSLASLAGCLVVALVAPPAMLLAVSLLVPAWTVVLHGCLALGGCLRRSRAGIEGTFRAVCFGQAALIGAPLPLLGDMISLIWSLALQSVGVARMHGCSRRRAAVAVTAPWLVLFAAVVLLVLLAPRAAPPPSG